jgi:predicted nucleic acid-binding protein
MIVFDASTLILLAKIEAIELFVSNFEGEVLIPKTVRAEVLKKGKEEVPLIKTLIDGKKIKISRLKDEKQTRKLMNDFNIAAGEAEAIVIALKKGSHAVATDDRNAIRACKMLRLEFITAITILIRAVEKGLISKEEATLKLQKLQSIGRYNKAIIEDAAKQIEGGV